MILMKVSCKVCMHSIAIGKCESAKLLIKCIHNNNNNCSREDFCSSERRS